jgi:hypothetical protein
MFDLDLMSVIDRGLNLPSHVPAPKTLVWFWFMTLTLLYPDTRNVQNRAEFSLCRYA